MKHTGLIEKKIKTKKMTQKSHLFCFNGVLH